MARKKRDSSVLSKDEKTLLKILTECAENDKPTPKMCDLLRAIGKNDRAAISETMKRLQDAGHITITNITSFKKQVYVASIGMTTKSTERTPPDPDAPKREKVQVLVPMDLSGRTFEDARVPKEVGRQPTPEPHYVPPKE